MSAVPGLRVPDGAQGPGPLASALVEALDLPMARRASGQHPGDRPAAGAGLGTELAQLRVYQPGDDVRQLDPAATARTGVPHVRLQVPERLLTTWIVLDLSPSMAFGTADRLKADVAAGVAHVVGRLAVRRGGRVALLTYGAPVQRFLAPRSGRGALTGLRRALTEGVAPDGQGGEELAPALTRIRRLARGPGLVCVISDFRSPLDWSRALRGLSVRHAVLAAEIRDPRETALPAIGQLALVDPESGRRLTVDTSSPVLRQRYADAERAGRAEVARTLRACRAEHVLLSTEGPWLRELGRGLR